MLCRRSLSPILASEYPQWPLASVVRGPGLIGGAEYYGAALIVLAVLALLALLRSEQKGSTHDHVCCRPEH